MYGQRERAQDALEEKLGAMGYESGNVEVTQSKVRPCTGTEALYRPYDPQRE